MQFENLEALMHMAGHGQYVWLAYGITIAVTVGLVIHPMLKRRRLINALRLAQMLDE